MEIVKLNKLFKPLYTTKKKYTILTGGRGSGKTFCVEDFTLRLLEEVGQGVLYTRFTMKAAKDSIIPLFKKYIDKVSCASKYIITANKIINKRTKAFVLFSGIKTSSGDQTGNLKSLDNITTWIVEEGEDFNSEETFIDIDDSIRSIHLQNRVIWIQNPTTNAHFIYKKFFEKTHVKVEVENAGTYLDEDGKFCNFSYQKSTHPKVEHIHTTYLNNIENLSTERVEEWEGTKFSNPKKYMHKYIGAWLDKSEGAIFTDWHEGDFDTSLPYGYGQDYGFSNDPTTLIKIAVDKRRKRVYWHEEYYESKMLGMEEIFQVNRSRIERVNDLIVGDSQEGRLIQDLRRKGLNIKPCKKGAGSVTAGITAMKDYTHIVTPSSMNIKREFNNYCWSDKKAEIPIDDYNHAIDAGRYIFNFLIKKKKGAIYG